MLPVGSGPLSTEDPKSPELQLFLRNFYDGTANIPKKELESVEITLIEIFHAGGRITEQVFMLNGTEKWPCLKRRDLPLKFIQPAEEPLSFKRYLIDQLAYFNAAPGYGIEATEEQITELFARLFPLS
jgi:hypothetical protein